MLTYTTIESIEIIPQSFNDKLVYIIKLHGELSSGIIDDVAKSINSLLEKVNQAYFVYDLTDCTYLNSAAVGYLTSWHMQITSKGGNTMIVGMDVNVKDLLETQGILTIIPSYQSVEDGLQALKLM